MLALDNTSVCTFRIRENGLTNVMCLSRILKNPAKKGLQYAYPITAQFFSKIEPTQRRLLTISTQGDFLAIWIYFVLHNCSLNFEIKILHFTTDSFLYKPSVLANPAYNTHKAFDCSANISNQYASPWPFLCFYSYICAHNNHFML